MRLLNHRSDVTLKLKSVLCNEIKYNGYLTYNK